LSHVASLDEIKKKDFSLNVPIYVQKYELGEVEESLEELVQQWNKTSNEVKQHTFELFSTLKEVI
jgi:type I restriction enzyme M protein